MAIKITTRNELGDVRHNIKTCINRQHVQGWDKLICYMILGGEEGLSTRHESAIRHTAWRTVADGGLEILSF